MKYRKSIAFTIAELCVVLSLIALLILILLPSLANSRQYSKKAYCQANLLQQGRAMQLFVNDNDGWIANPWYFQFGNGNLWGRHDILPMWSRDSKKLPDQPDGTYPDGLLWQYLQTEDVWQCPNIPYTPVYGPWGTTQNAYWGFPDVRWSYTANGQPGFSMGNNSLIVKQDRVRPSPTSVFMIFEEWPYDKFAFNDSVSLFYTTYTPGKDSLSDCHAGGGNLVFFDGHVEWMHREDDYLQRVSTEEGTINLCGGYVGFYW